MLNVWPLAVFFTGVAVLATAWLHTGGPVTAVAAGSLIGMYVVDLVGKLAEPIEPLRALSASSTTARRSRTASTRSPSPASS
jgi:ABC-2 type transport system permease protein